MECPYAAVQTYRLTAPLIVVAGRACPELSEKRRAAEPENSFESSVETVQTGSPVDPDPGDSIWIHNTGILYTYDLM